MPRVRFTPGCDSRTRERPAGRGHTASGCIAVISGPRNGYLLIKERGQGETSGDINVTRGLPYNSGECGVKPRPREMPQTQECLPFRLGAKQKSLGSEIRGLRPGLRQSRAVVRRKVFCLEKQSNRFSWKMKFCVPCNYRMNPREKLWLPQIRSRAVTGPSARSDPTAPPQHQATVHTPPLALGL